MDVYQNISFFTDVDHAVNQLGERLRSYDECLIVVMSKSVMTVAVGIAKALGINVRSVTAENDAEMGDIMSGASYDYKTINTSGRDIPQNFIYRQEQNLRANLRDAYARTDKSMAIKFPGKVVILVDELKNNGTQFLTPLKKNSAPPERITLSAPTGTLEESNLDKSNMRFVLVHAANQDSESEMDLGFDIIIDDLNTRLN